VQRMLSDPYNWASRTTCYYASIQGEPKIGSSFAARTFYGT
jgi:hypothetical protein